MKTQRCKLLAMNHKIRSTVLCEAANRDEQVEQDLQRPILFHTLKSIITRSTTSLLLKQTFFPLQIIVTPKRRETPLAAVVVPKVVVTSLHLLKLLEKLQNGLLVVQIISELQKKLPSSCVKIQCLFIQWRSLASKGLLILLLVKITSCPAGNISLRFPQRSCYLPQRRKSRQSCNY